MEYCDRYRESKHKPVLYSEFCKRYGSYKNRTRKYSSVIERKSGASCEVDWAGSTISWLDFDSGLSNTAYLFVGCLSYSRFFYVEAFGSMAGSNWIAAHNHMFKAFGGVPQ